jgi:hypothetical protein
MNMEQEASERVGALFAGTPSPFGGLSNERELALLVPAKYKGHHNPWSQAAMLIFFSGGRIDHWKWRDSACRTQQLACFKALIGSFGIGHEQKEAVAGWMLSQMLQEVPEHRT